MAGSLTTTPIQPGTAVAPPTKSPNPADVNPNINYWYPSGYQTPESQSKPGAQYAGNLPEYTPGIEDYAIPSANPVPPNQNLKNIMMAQLGQASSYEKNYPSQINAQANIYNQQAKQNLAKGIQQTRQDFNTRGLLKSGQRQGAEYGQAANTAADMANNKYQLNQGALATQNQLEQNAYNTGLLYSGNAPGIGAAALAGTGIGVQNDLANMENANTVASAGGKALGRLATTIGTQNN